MPMPVEACDLLLAAARAGVMLPEHWASVQALYALDPAAAPATAPPLPEPCPAAAMTAPAPCPWGVGAGQRLSRCPGRFRHPCQSRHHRRLGLPGRSFVPPRVQRQSSRRVDRVNPNGVNPAR